MVMGHVTVRVALAESVTETEAWASALFAGASPGLAPFVARARAALCDGSLPIALVEPSFAIERSSALRVGLNAASDRAAPDRAALTVSLLEALGAPATVRVAARRCLADPAHEVFVAVADGPSPRAKVYLRAPIGVLAGLLAPISELALPRGARTIALDLVDGSVVALRSYESLDPDDPRVVSLARDAGVTPARAHLARRLDGPGAGEQIVHLQVEDARSLAPAERLFRAARPADQTPPWRTLSARFPLHARVLARSSGGELTVYLALSVSPGVRSRAGSVK